MTDISELIWLHVFLCNWKTFPNLHLIDSQRLTAKVICASSGQTVFTLWQYFCIWSDRRWKNKHHLFASITTAFTCQPRAHARAPAPTPLGGIRLDDCWKKEADNTLKRGALGIYVHWLHFWWHWKTFLIIRLRGRALFWTQETCTHAFVASQLLVPSNNQTPKNTFLNLASLGFVGLYFSHDRVGEAGFSPYQKATF